MTVARQATYGPAGNLRPGVIDGDVERHFRERNAWDEANPMPVEIVQHCSGDYPMYIVAALGSKIVAKCGSLEYVDIAKMTNLIYVDGLRVINFCEKYLKPINEYDEFPEMAVEWWLVSNWL